MLDLLVSGLIEGTRQAVEAAGVQTPDAVRHYPQLLARLTAEAAAVSEQLRRLLHQKVYDSPELAQERESTGRKVDLLFQLFMEHPERLPQPYQQQAAEEPLHRLVCDYIAGMTDKFLLARYGELVESG